MPTVSEIVVAIEAAGTDAVLAALKQVDGAQAKVVSNSQSAGAAQKAANEGVTASWQMMAVGVNQALGVVNAALAAGRAVYDFAKEGAQLEYAAGKFDRLSVAVGTTSQALLGDLKTATRGMVSDVELMGSAGDFMALGLAKSHDEVVRLTNVAGALGMNMNQLVLTLTNKTTMRFDALGVSVDGFKEKVKALEAAGMSADSAFNEAFLQQAEEQIEKVGNIAETSAGKFKYLEAEVANFWNSLKQDAMDETKSPLAGWTEALTRAFELKNADTVNKQIIDLGKNLGIISKIEAGMVNAPLFGSQPERQKAADFITDVMDKLKAGNALTQAWADANDRVYEGVSKMRMEEISDATVAQIEQMRATTNAFAGDWKSMAKMALDYDMVLTAIGENDKAIAELNSVVNGTASEFNGVKMSAEDAKKKIEEFKAAGADLEDAYKDIGANMTFQMLQTSMEVGGYTKGEIQALTDFMVEAGMTSRAAADAMIENFSGAMKRANEYEIDQKVGEILADTSKYENGLKIVDGRLVDAKTGKVMADINDYLDGLSDVELSKLDPKIVLILAELAPYLAAIRNIPDPGSKTVDVWMRYRGAGTQSMRAVGGTVYPGQDYLWQEPGREGELLLTERYGRVMSNHEVAQAIRDARLMVENGGHSRNVSNSSVKNVTYQVNSPQYKGEPILTLSEHLRILSALEDMS